MKTINRSKPIACGAFGMLGVFGFFLCSLIFARAQEVGQCTEQVLSAPTESSVKVRLKGVSQWPANPICTWSFSDIRADGKTYTWDAVLVGDGFWEDPDTHLITVNVAVVFSYSAGLGTRLSGYKQVGVDFFYPFPSPGFTTLVDNHVTTLYTDGDVRGFPALSVQGSIHLDASNNLISDITFTGGVADSDGDGILDDMDQCPDTPAGNVVNEQGCSIDQLVPCVGPSSGGAWRTHGQYVSSVGKVAEAFLASGLITKEQRATIMEGASRSGCGKK